ncbi:hypothetical protein JHK84_049815 [Glycine max]|nr:hypothetical protein JHK85_050525 [Glycine max]KAG5094227.1 hypothetical protein JHK84_049815 [Glycine max]
MSLEICCYLDLTSNHLIGKLPHSVGQIKGLLVLGLSSNSLFGPIPASVGNLSNLRALCLEGNMMNGKVPRNLPLGRGVVVANAVEQELALPKKESLCAMGLCVVGLSDMSVRPRLLVMLHFGREYGR